MFGQKHLDHYSRLQPLQPFFLPDSASLIPQHVRINGRVLTARGLPPAAAISPTQPLFFAILSRIAACCFSQTV